MWGTTLPFACVGCVACSFATTPPFKKWTSGNAVIPTPEWYSSRTPEWYSSFLYEWKVNNLLQQLYRGQLIRAFNRLNTHKGLFRNLLPVNIIMDGHEALFEYSRAKDLFGKIVRRDWSWFHWTRQCTNHGVWAWPPGKIFRNVAERWVSADPPSMATYATCNWFSRPGPTTRKGLIYPIHSTYPLYIHGTPYNPSIIIVMSTIRLL